MNRKIVLAILAIIVAVGGGLYSLIDEDPETKPDATFIYESVIENVEIIKQELEQENE